MAALLLLACACRCGEPAPGPAPGWLPKVPEGYGRPFRAGVTLRVQDRRLVLPSGMACLGLESSCAQALARLRGEDLVLELDEALKMADLSAALAALAEALDPGDQACLAAFDGKERRCVPSAVLRRDFGACSTPTSRWARSDRDAARRAGGGSPNAASSRADPLRAVAALAAARPTTPRRRRGGAARGPLRTRTPRAVPSASIPWRSGEGALVLSGPQGERFERTFLVYPSRRLG
jgi:hypothetical protein